MQPEAVDSLVVSVSADVPVLYTKKIYADAKTYVLSQMERFYLTSMPRNTGSMTLIRSETIPLNQSGLQNSIMGPFGVLSLSAEKIYGVYEIHVKIKQVLK